MSVATWSSDRGQVWRPYLAPGLVVLLSAGALAVAFLAQYQYGLLPCVLCVWQRWAYGAALACGLAGLAVARRPEARQGALFLAGLAFLCVTAIAAVHVGVELDWWAGSDSCQGADLSSATSRADLKAAILNAPVIACDDIPWSLGGISIAGFNALFSLAFAAMTFWLAFRRPAR